VAHRSNSYQIKDISSVRFLINRQLDSWPRLSPELFGGFALRVPLDKADAKPSARLTVTPGITTSCFDNKEEKSINK
jgi:hypothetical protein